MGSSSSSQAGERVAVVESPLASASSPGKVLICGGYKIVEENNPGISLGVNARFKTCVVSITPSLHELHVAFEQLADKTNGVTSERGGSIFVAPLDHFPKHIIKVVVLSPQFQGEFVFFVSLFPVKKGYEVDKTTQERKENKKEIDDISVMQESGPPAPFLYYGLLYSFASILDVARQQERQNISKNHNFFTPVIMALSMLTSITLKLKASNHFYSQRNYLNQVLHKEVTVENLRNLVPDCNPIVGEVSKTGLGSSAALTASFVGALHSFFQRISHELSLCNNNNSVLKGQKGAFDIFTVSCKEADSYCNTERIHRVSQIAHSVAQCKIGSGFDVCTAVYGTTCYRRFPAEIAEVMMPKKKMQSFEEDSCTSSHLLAHCIDLSKPWLKYSPFFKLSDLGVILVLADIHQGGSGTPGMVAKIMKWKNELLADPSTNKTDNLWYNLGQVNEKCIELLFEMKKFSKEHRDEWVTTIHQLSKIPSSQWPTIMSIGEQKSAFTEIEKQQQKQATVAATSTTTTAISATQGTIINYFISLKTCFNDSRFMLRQMGQEADVEVEPTCLTSLLDDTMEDNAGVVAVGCPGAGGYDAIFALILTEHGGERLEHYWEQYNSKRHLAEEERLHVCPLVVREDVLGICFNE